MTWNHRVVEVDDGEDETLLMICEVYYHRDGRPRMRNEGARVSGSNYTELQLDLDRMAGALKKPRLKASDFVTE
jgi:hypothetical protein